MPVYFPYNYVIFRSIFQLYFRNEQKQGVLTTRFSNDPDCLIMVFDSDRGPDCEETLKLTLLTPVHGMVTASQYVSNVSVS